MCVNNLPIVALDSGGGAWIRNRHLLIASPASYRYATEPHILTGCRLNTVRSSWRVLFFLSRHLATHKPSTPSPRIWCDVNAVRAHHSKAILNSRVMFVLSRLQGTTPNMGRRRWCHVSAVPNLNNARHLQPLWSYGRTALQKYHCCYCCYNRRKTALQLSSSANVIISILCAFLYFVLNSLRRSTSQKLMLSGRYILSILLFPFYFYCVPCVRFHNKNK